MTATAVEVDVDLSLEAEDADPCDNCHGCQKQAVWRLHTTCGMHPVRLHCDGHWQEMLAPSWIFPPGEYICGLCISPGSRSMAILRHFEKVTKAERI